MHSVKFSGHTISYSRLLPTATVLLLLLFPLHALGTKPTDENLYVGSMACRECHPEEYNNFVTYSKKSASFESIKKQMKHLTPQEIEKCYPCHTTGYGKPGGFISQEETPHLKNAGCEVCHGPGALHVKTEAPEAIIGHLSKKDCEICHISERVKVFKYKPLIHGGAH